MQAKVQLH